MKFKEHLIKQPELLLCGDCPFLRFPVENSLGEINHKSPHQKNECGIERHNFGKADKFKRGTWEILAMGPNPKRTKGCLQLCEHFHSQLTKKKELKMINTLAAVVVAKEVFTLHCVIKQTKSVSTK